MDSLTDLDNPVLRSYIFYAALVSIKFILVIFLTIKARVTKKVFASPEDTTLGGKVVYDDPDVERVRRAQMNDLENIPIFLILGLVYVTTDPTPWVAATCFRLFTFARYAHTYVYVIHIIRQPTRAICFFLGTIVNIFMAVNIIRACA